MLRSFISAVSGKLQSKDDGQSRGAEKREGSSASQAPKLASTDTFSDARANTDGEQTNAGRAPSVGGPAPSFQSSLYDGFENFEVPEGQGGGSGARVARVAVDVESNSA